MNNIQKNDIDKILKQYDLKVTTKRIYVLFEFLNNNKSISAEEVYINLNSKGIKINLATVYRIIEIFVQKGLLVKSCIVDRKCLYHIKDKEHYHFFVCIKCNKKSEINQCFIEEIEMSLKQKNYTVLSHNMEIYGICDLCGGSNNED
ncbi:Fur family transcriptional regulator [Caldicellulosiruptoraceae bacterium PP1]